MVKNAIFHIGVLLLVLATGCIKSNNANNNQGNNQDTLANNIHVASQELFPNMVGDRWRYLVIDTTIHVNQDSSSTQYFVEIAIVDTTKIPDGITATIWQYKYPDHTDSQYVYRTGDTIKILANSYGLSAWSIYFSVHFRFNLGICVRGLPDICPSSPVTGPANITVGQK